jgi:hypothetical protein
LNPNSPVLKQEMRLLLLSSQLFVSAEDSERIKALCHSPIDWEVFLRLVDRHRVYPFVYRHLAGFAPGRIPNYLVKELSDRVEKNTRHALTLTGEVVRLFKLLLQSDIPLIPLKGPVLALQIYEDVGLRHAGDLDLLVLPQHVEEADQILCDEGYKRLNPDFSLTPRQLALFLRVGDHFMYYHDGRQIKVELHWWWNSNPYLFPLDMEQVWKHGQTVAVADAQVKTLVTDDLLLYLCSHGARHVWSRLFWACDVAALVRKNPSFDWTRLMARAMDLNVGRSLAEGLIMLNLLFGDRLPDAVQVYVKEDRIVGRMVDMSLKSLVMPLGNSAHELFLGQFRNKRHALKLYSKPLYKLSCLTSLCTSPRDWSFLRLPDVLFPLYFVLRPFLWFWRWFLIRKLHRLHR